MNVQQELHAAHKARRERMTPCAESPEPLPRPEPIFDPMMPKIVNPPSQRDILRLESKPRIFMAEILRAVCAETRIPEWEIKSAARQPHIVRARRLFFILANMYSRQPFTRMAKFIDRDHSTAMHHVEKPRDDAIILAIRAIERRLGIYCGGMGRDKP